MAEIEPTERSLAGEMFAYSLRHPLKAVGNTIIAAYGIHLAREWGGHIVNGLTKQQEPRGRQDDESQISEIEQ